MLRMHFLIWTLLRLGDMRGMDESLYVTTDLTKIQKDTAIYLHSSENMGGTELQTPSAHFHSVSPNCT